MTVVVVGSTAVVSGTGVVIFCALGAGSFKGVGAVGAAVGQMASGIKLSWLRYCDVSTGPVIFLLPGLADQYAASCAPPALIWLHTPFCWSAHACWFGASALYGVLPTQLPPLDGPL